MLLYWYCRRYCSSSALAFEKTRIKKPRYAGKGCAGMHSNAQLSNYRNWYTTTPIAMPTKISLGNQDGNTTSTICGIGLIGMTMSSLLYTTCSKLGCTSVLLVWAPARGNCELWFTPLSKHSDYAEAVFFIQLRQFAILSQSVQARWLSCFVCSWLY